MRRGATLIVAISMTLAISAMTPAPAPAAATTLAAADQALRTRVTDDGLRGGMLLVARGEQVVHRFSTGSTRLETVMPIASASKWLASATLMTFVDDGALSLDDPVARHLPAFGGGKSTITVRELLSHTTGLPSASCEGNPTTTLRRCVASIAAGPDPSVTPGTEFHYSGVGFAVAGRLIERLSGMSFQEAFAARMAGPLGMRRTRFDGRVAPHNRNPSPAGSATSTVSDYARFLRMLAAGGTFDGHQILTPSSVSEIERDQVRGLDTRDDEAVQITQIPTYGLGVWRDEVGPDDTIEVVSGSGALGFYPWIDRMHGTYGIVAVDDELHGAEHAVPASQRIVRHALERGGVLTAAPVGYNLMTYCLALRLNDGLVFLADTRTNAGVDNVSTYRKLHVLRPSDDRVFVIESAGTSPPRIAELPTITAGDLETVTTTE